MKKYFDVGSQIQKFQSRGGLGEEQKRKRHISGKRSKEIRKVKKKRLEDEDGRMKRNKMLEEHNQRS